LTTRRDGREFPSSTWQHGERVKCATCGSRTYPNADRTLHCPNCRITFDRDENAAKNILAKGGLRFKPDGPPAEAVKGNEQTTALILRVDGGKMTQG